MGASCSAEHFCHEAAASCGPEAWQEQSPELHAGEHLEGGALHRVEVAATCLGLGIPGLQVYHTSILVDGIEYYFGPSGVNSTTDCGSHRNLRNKPSVLPMGRSRIPGEEMKRMVSKLFRAGSYDVIQKNCNTFSDCALYYLLGSRLGWRYRGLDQAGAALDKQDSALMQGLLQALGVGVYVPNPEAAGFNISESLKWLSDVRDARTARKHAYCEEVVRDIF